MSFPFGASYYPLHRPRHSWVDDLDLMLAANVNALRVGDFAWTSLEPHENQWDFAWLDEFLELAGERRIDILLIPPIRCAPAWLVERDPTIQIVDDAGMRLEFGSRYTFCINHPLFRSKGLAVTERMAERYAGHAALIGWHLDNEYGDEPDCHCDVCRTRWHDWLADRYGSIDRLNEAWGTVFWSQQYTGFQQVPTPRLSKTYHQPALQMAWRRFRSECTVTLMRQQRDIIRRFDSHRPVTSNLQCLWNPRTDYYALHDVLDVAGMNYYPPYGPAGRDNALGIAIVRNCVGPGMEIHELRNSPHAVPGRADNTPEPGEIERLTMHTVAHGADAIYYFQWAGVRFGIEQTHGTIIGYDGKPRRAYGEVARIGEKLKRIVPLLKGTTVRSDVALLYDFPTRWLMQASKEWTGPGGMYVAQARKIYNAVRLSGINCDAVGRSQDWSHYKILIVPMLDLIDDALVDRLTRFVEAGGVLIWHPLSGIRNVDAEIYPRRLHGGLESLFGVSVREYATAGDGQSQPFEWNGKTYAGELFMDLPEPTTSATLAAYSDGWISRTPAVCCNTVGRGRAIYCATFAEAGFYRDFIESLIGQVGVRSILDCMVPQAIEVVERSSPDGARLIFMINTTGQTQQLTIREPMHDVWNDQPLAGSVTFEAWQVRIGYMPAKDSK